MAYADAVAALQVYLQVASNKPTTQQVAFTAKKLENFSVEAIHAAIEKHFDKTNFFPLAADLLPHLDRDRFRQRPLPPPMPLPSVRQLPEPPESTPDNLKRKILERGEQYRDGFSRYLEVMAKGCLGLSKGSGFSYQLKSAVIDLIGIERFKAIRNDDEQRDRFAIRFGATE